MQPTASRKRAMKRLVGQAITLLILLVLLPPHILTAAEPRYQGRTFLQWTQDMSDLDPRVRRAAAQALGTFGARAIPLLIHGLNDTDTYVSSNSFTALRRIGSPAIPTLVTALQRGTQRQRLQAAALLGQLNATSPDAVSSLLRAARAEDALLRDNSLRSLSQIVPDDPAVLEVLLKATLDPAVHVRYTAIKALGKSTKPGAKVIQTLSTTLRDPASSINLKSAAAQALGTIGRSASIALAEALNDADSTTRWAAGQALVGITTPDPAIATAVVQALRHNDPWSVSLAAQVLPAIGEPAVPPLALALQDSNRNVRAAAAEILGRLGPIAHGAASALSDTLIDKDVYVRAQALSALRRLGAGAAAAAPQVVALLVRVEVELLGDSSDDGIAILTTVGRPVVPFVAAALADPRLVYAGGLFSVLIELGPNANEAVPALIRALEDPKRQVRYHLSALQTVRAIGPAAADVAGAVGSLVEHNNRQIRDAAALTLKKMAPAGIRGAIPPLVRALARQGQSKPVMDQLFKTILVYGDAAIPELEHLRASEPELTPVINELVKALRDVPHRP